MTEFIDTITGLMPLSSNFDGSDMQSLLDETLGAYFDSKEEDIEEVLDAPFLSEADDDYLDLIHGQLYSIKRKPEETDEEYRSRLVFQAKDHLTVPDLRELDCKVYAYVDEYNPASTLTSRNTGLTRKLIIECPTPEVEALVKDNMIWQGVVVFV